MSRQVLSMTITDANGGSFTFDPDELFLASLNPGPAPDKGVTIPASVEFSIPASVEFSMKLCPRHLYKMTDRAERILRRVRWGMDDPTLLFELLIKTTLLVPGDWLSRFAEAQAQQAGLQAFCLGDHQPPAQAK